MTHSDHMHNDMQFENDIEKFTPPEQFLARQLRELNFKLVPINERICVIEKECKKRAETCANLVSQTGVSNSKTLATGAGIGGGSTIILYLILKAALAYFGITI